MEARGSKIKSKAKDATERPGKDNGQLKAADGQRRKPPRGDKAPSGATLGDASSASVAVEDAPVEPPALPTAFTTMPPPSSASQAPGASDTDIVMDESGDAVTEINAPAPDDMVIDALPGEDVANSPDAESASPSERRRDGQLEAGPRRTSPMTALQEAPGTPADTPVVFSASRQTSPAQFSGARRVAEAASIPRTRTHPSEGAHLRHIWSCWRADSHTT